MYSNLIPFNFCAHALRFKLWGQMRYIPQPGFVCKSFCRPLSHKVSLSWLPCSAADKQMGEQRREGAGWGGVFEWDAHWPCHHHKPPVWSNILTGWMSGWLGTYQANSPQLQSLFQHQRLSTYTTQSLVVNGGWTTLRGWCLCPDKIWNKSKSSSEMLLATLDQSSHVDTHIPARRA